MVNRTDRLNSLLKAVLSEVIMKDVKNPDVHPLTTVTNVDISKDLHHAKVYVSIIGTEEDKNKTVKALESAAGFIAVTASKKVVMRYFPALTFRLDCSVDKQMRVDNILAQIHDEQNARNESDPTQEG